MGKHTDAESKLGISPNVRAAKKMPKRNFTHQPNSPSGPPTRINSKNQFR
jgi:hypothetical protein